MFLRPAEDHSGVTSTLRLQRKRETQMKHGEGQTGSLSIATKEAKEAKPTGRQRPLHRQAGSFQKSGKQQRKEEKADKLRVAEIVV